MDKGKVMKWANRGGALAMLAGYVLLKFHGKDPEELLTVGDLIITAAGALIIVIKESLNVKKPK